MSAAEDYVTVGALVFLLGMLLFAPGVLAILARKEPAPQSRTNPVSSARKAGRR